MTTTPRPPCLIPDCHRPQRIRGMCRTHYSREYARAQRGTSDYFTPADFTPRSTRTIAHLAEPDVQDFEYLIDSGASLTEALTRTGISGRSMIRRYQHLGRAIPSGLWAAAEEKKRSHA